MTSPDGPTLPETRRVQGERREKLETALAAYTDSEDDAARRSVRAAVMQARGDLVGLAELFNALASDEGT